MKNASLAVHHCLLWKVSKGLLDSVDTYQIGIDANRPQTHRSRMSKLLNCVRRTVAGSDIICG